MRVLVGGKKHVRRGLKLVLLRNKINIRVYYNERNSNHIFVSARNHKGIQKPYTGKITLKSVEYLHFNILKRIRLDTTIRSP